MKARIRPSKQEVNRAEQVMRTAIIRNNMRLMYIACLAANRRFGAGNKRLHAYVDDMLKLSEEFRTYQDDDVGDEILLRAVRKIMPDVERLFPEEVEV